MSTTSPRRPSRIAVIGVSSRSAGFHRRTTAEQRDRRRLQRSLHCRCANVSRFEASDRGSRPSTFAQREEFAVLGPGWSRHERRPEGRVEITHTCLPQRAMLRFAPSIGSCTVTSPIDVVLDMLQGHRRRLEDVERQARRGVDDEIASPD